MRSSFGSAARQLGEVHRRPTGLVTSQQLRRRPTTGLILEIEIAERLPGGVLHDEARIVVLFDDPGRLDAAGYAHDRAFALFKGGIYDNMKTAVETIFVGKGRLYNRRFLQMCSHYLVDPIACTPASGRKKGQVENQVRACPSAVLHAASAVQES